MKIVYIEDNPLNFRLIRRMLGTDEVFGAMTGFDGVKLVWQEKPDIVLLDINLPDIDGFKVLNMLRSNPNCKHIPVIAVTGYAMNGARQNILAAGFNGYLAKPFSRIELQNTILNLGARV